MSKVRKNWYKPINKKNKFIAWVHYYFFEIVILALLIYFFLVGFFINPSVSDTREAYEAYKIEHATE